jgi:glycosyltransferase involved in cell wall biosynthesis
VLLPIYNAESHIEETLNSLFNQSFKDFEVIAVDDGSKDRSFEILSRYPDPRLKVFQNKNNMGISGTLNRAISLSNGTYLARMDADDLCRTDRLEMQVQFLDQNSDIDIIGSNIRLFGATITRVIRNPIHDLGIKSALFFNSAMAHPTVMFRASKINKNDYLYDSHFNKAEDYELWTRLAFTLNFANIDEPLLDYRIHASQISTASAQKQAELASEIRLNLFKKLEVPFTEEQIKLHEKITHWNFSRLTKEDFTQIMAWMKLLGDCAEKHGFTTKEAVRNEFCSRFTIAYYSNYYRMGFRKKVKEFGLFKPELLRQEEKYFYLMKSARDVARFLKRKILSQTTT